MMMRDRINLLKAELSSMDNATEILRYSYDSCQKIENKERYTLDELDKFEAFTSRFARLSDMVIQKMFRLIDEIDLEDGGTVRDRINRAEKKNLINSADIFIQIRIVRNDIAHEYTAESLKDIFKKVLELTPHLLESVKNIKTYCQKFLKNP